MRDPRSVSRRPPSAPLRLPIQDVAFGGKGVGRTAGKAVFVPWVIDGEEAVVQVQRSKKSWAEAELLEIVQSSPHRVEPRCPYFGRCGGCAYQHISYEHQLELKSRQVEQTLRRVGQFAEVPMRPIVASPLQYEYRNRIRVHVADGDVGFYAARSSELIDIEFCPISQPRVNQELAEIREAHVPDGDYSLRARRTGAYFEQTNDEVAAAMVQLVTDLASPPGELLIDAYCGAGLFAKQFAASYSRVVGIEENAEAIGQALKSAAENEEYLIGDVGEYLPGILQSAPRDETTLLLDPPAVGLTVRVAEMIALAPPARLIYISCDPATLARDLRSMQDAFVLESVTPLDMFPQTAEIEVVAQLARRT